jgi:protein ImuA
MPEAAAAWTGLRRLRWDIARVEGRCLVEERLARDFANPDDGGSSSAALQPHIRHRLKFGIARLDSLLGGGLSLGALHEMRAAETRDGGALMGFAVALLARLVATGMPAIAWISEADAAREAGEIYAPGLAELGLDPARILKIAARSEKEALWAFEAALSCHSLGAAICELRQASLDLSATRRCALRAREAGVTGLLLRLGSRAEPSAAELRFLISPAPAGTIGKFSDGVGRMAWRVTLEKNRGGPTGAFTVEWNSHVRSFVERGNELRQADSQPLSATYFNRSSVAWIERPEALGFRFAS